MPTSVAHSGRRRHVSLAMLSTWAVLAALLVTPAAAAAGPPLPVYASTFEVGSRPTSVAAGDFDGDGRPDMAVANNNSSSVSVLLGAGDGSLQTQLTYAVGTLPTGVAVGDLNGDGKPDLAVTNYGNDTISVLLGVGDGTFQGQVTYPVSVPPDPFTHVSGTARPSAIAIGDFNGDGKLDLLAANNDQLTSGHVSLLLGNGDGTFQGQQSIASVPGGGVGLNAVAVGDFNGDGRLDYVVGGGDPQSGTRAQVMLGNGAGGFTLGQGLAAGGTPTSIAVGDLNGDGKQDITVANHSTDLVSVHLGIGDGTFQTVASYGVGSGPRSVAVGDLDGDGTPDLTVANSGGRSLSVLLGNGDGTFQAHQAFTAGNTPYSVAVADLNGDGKSDVTVANNLDATVQVLTGLGDGTLVAQGQYTYSLGFKGTGLAIVPSDIAQADFNGDGNFDLVTANGDDASVSLLWGNGDGTFQAPTKRTGTNGARQLAVADFNSDGTWDLAWGNGSALMVMLGSGGGGFSAPKLSTGTGSTWGLAAADFDADGRPDIAVANPSDDTVSMRLGNGDGTLKPEVKYGVGDVPRSVAVGDFNGDNRLDLAVANSTGDSVSTLLGNGDGTFQPSVAFATGIGPVSVATRDFNADSNVDLAVANDDGTVSVLISNGDGTFQPQLTYAAGQTLTAIEIADVNGDGSPDLVVAGFTTSAAALMVLVGNGDGTFQPATLVPFVTNDGIPAAIAVGPYNADSTPDIATVFNNGASAAATGSVTVLNSNAFVSAGFVSAQIPASASTTGTGSVLINQLRYKDAGGQFAELYNTTSSPASVGGWQLQSDTGAFVTIPLGTVLPANGHLLLAGPGYSLSSYAPPNSGLFDTGWSSPPAPAGGMRLVAPGGAVIDKVGFVGAHADFVAGTALSTPPAFPSGQFAWIRKYSAGAPVNTNDNAADFSYVSTSDNDAAHGSPVLGAPGPGNLVSPTARNDILQSGLVSPGVPASSSPNRIVSGTSPRTLIVNRTVTNCSGQPQAGACLRAPAGTTAQTVRRLRFRITALTTLNSPGAGASQAVLKAASSADQTGLPGANSCNGTTTVFGLTLDAPSISGAGGLGSTWTATPKLPPGGLAPGQCINVAFKFHITQNGSFSFAYNAEAAR